MRGVALTGLIALAALVVGCGGSSGNSTSQSVEACGPGTGKPSCAGKPDIKPPSAKERQRIREENAARRQRQQRHVKPKPAPSAANDVQQWAHKLAILDGGDLTEVPALAGHLKRLASTCRESAEQIAKLSFGGSQVLKAHGKDENPGEVLVHLDESVPGNAPTGFDCKGVLAAYVTLRTGGG